MINITIEISKQLNDLEFGDHLCFIYENQEEQYQLIIPFLLFGLNNNEKCIYITNENTKENIIQAFKKVDELEKYVKLKQLEFFTKEEIYLQSGHFDPERILNLLIQMEKLAIEEGYKGLRVTGEMTWILTGLPKVERILEYEAKLNYFLQKSKCITLCQYNKTKFLPKFLLDIIYTHPKIIINSKLCENPYYIPPTEFLARMRGDISYSIYERVTNDIFERMTKERENKAVIKKLKESKERYRLITENANDMICILNKKFIFEYINEQVHQKILGYTKNDLIGQNVINLLPPEYITENFVEEIRKRWEPGEATFTLKFRKKDGTYIWLETRGRKFTDLDGEEKVLLITRDNNERRLAERRIKESEKKYRLITENINDTIAILNNKFKVEYVNEEAHRKILGYTKEELFNLDANKYIHPDDILKIIELANRNRKKGEGDVELRFRRKDRKYVWMELRGKKFVDLDGKQKFIVIGRDITKRKFDEDKLKESEEKYRLITENLNDLLIILNKKFRIEYINEEVHQKILGYNRENLINKDVMPLCHPDDLVKGLELGRRRWEKGEGQIEFRIKKKDRNYIWVEIKGRRFFDREGKEKFLFVGRDINERKKAERELKESEERYRLITENANDMITVFNHKFKLMYINEPVHQKVLGYSKDEVLGKDTLKFVHPDDYSKILEMGRKGWFEKRSIVEFRCKKKDGTYIWLESKASRFTNKDGKDRTILFSRDITGRKQAEENLKKSEEKYRLITENIRDLVTIVNNDFNIDFINQETHKQVLGKIDQNKKGISNFAQIHPDDFEKIISLIKKCFETDKLITSTVRLRNQNGKYLLFEVKGKTFIDEYGDKKIIAISRDITKRKETEDKLKESEEKYRLITENANDLIYLLNGRFEFEFINEQTFFRLLGYSNKDILGKSAITFVYLEDREKTAKSYIKCIETGKGSFEYRFRHKNGKFIWVEAEGRKFTNNEGNEKILIISRDVTERKRVNAKLKESETKYSTLVEQARDGVAIVQDGIFKFANKALGEITGYKVNELIGTSFINYIALKQKEEAAQEIKQRLAGKRTPLLYETKIQCKDGTIKDVDVSAIFIKYKGKLANMGVLRDITDRKLAEQKIKESEEKYRLITENANDLISILNENMKFEFINERIYLKILGYSKDELIGKNPINLIHPDDLEFIVKTFKKVFETEEERAEYRFKRKNGTYIWLDARGIIFKDVDGKRKALVISTDISERKQNEEMIKEKNKFLTNVIESLTYPFYVINAKDYKVELSNLAGSFGDLTKNSTCFSLTHKSDKPCSNECLCPLEEVKKTKKAVVTEHYHYNKNGNSKIFEVHGYPILDKDGNITQIIEYSLDISERKKAEEKLKESEEKYHGLYDSLKDGVLMTDMLGNILECNRAFLDMLDYSENEIKKLTYQDLTPKKWHRIEDMIVKEKILKIGYSDEYEKEYIKKDGTVLPVNIRVWLIKNEQGKAKGMWGIVRNITERKKAEKELKESEEKYRLITENANDIIAVINDRFKFEFINEKTFQKITGYSKNEVIGKDLFKFIHAEDQFIVFSEGKKYWKTGEGISEIRIRIKSGDYRWFETKGKKYYNTQGKFRLLFFCRDITERRKAEQDLRESEEKFRTITEQSSMGIYIVQSNSIVYMNNVVSKINEYTIQEMMKWSPNDFLKTVHPDDLPLILQRMNIIQNREMNLEPFTNRIITKFGNMKWIEIYTKSIQYQGKSALLGIIIDVTEKKKAEANYQDLYHSAPIAYLSIGENSEIKMVNEAAERFLGYNLSEFQKMRVFDLYAEESKTKAQHLFKKFKHGGSWKNIEMLYKKKNGEKVYGLLSVSPIIGEGGKVLESRSVIVDITEKKESERALKEERERAQKYLDIAGVIFLATNLEGKVTLINQKGCEILGYEQNEIIDKNWLENFLPEIVKDEVRSIFLKAINGNLESFEYNETPILTKDGKELYIAWHNTILKDENGEAIGTLSSGEDITKRKLAELKLIESELKYRLISENANDLISVINQRIEFEYINEEAYQKLLGISRGEIIGRSPLDLIHPDDLETAIKTFKISFKTGEGMSELRLKRKDGTYIWFEVKGKTFLDKDGEIKAIVISRDITDRKWAEKKILESEEKFRTISENTFTGIIILQDNKVKYANLGMEKITEYSKKAIMNWTIKNLIDNFHPAHKPFVIERLRKKSTGETTFVPNYTFKFFSKSQNVKWIEIYSKVINYQESPADLIIFIDVTERKEIENELIKSQQELMEKNKLAAVGQLAAGVAHGLNTPLANINLTAEYIYDLVHERMNLPNSTILLKEIADIKTQVQFCAQIVKDLLQFSRKMDLNLSKFELNELFKEIVESPAISSKISKNRIEILFENKKISEMEGDKRLLFEVFQNLINNSIDALKDKKVRPEIKIRLLNRDNKLEIKIVDNGIGIKPSDMPRIFEPFFSTKQVGQGTGLGLSICRGIIEKHGGKISINSIYGKGTEVIVTLPIYYSIKNKV